MQALLTRLVVSEEQRNGRDAAVRPRRQKPKAIYCKSFKIGDNFPNYLIHYKQCVKASYEDGLTEAELQTAYLTWLSTKLEPGPTVIAYDSLDDDVKKDWESLVDALTDAYSDETEREMFLTDVASFKRGSKSLVEYKNELMRLMNTYQPDLRGVGKEYQRQLTTRFIEGLEDDSLKRKLRRHCKRDRMTLEEAYIFTVDYEASELQSSVREGVAAAFAGGTLAVMDRPTTQSVIRHSLTSAGSGRSDYGQIQADIDSLKARSGRIDEGIAGLEEESARTNERIVGVSSEASKLTDSVTRLTTTMENRMDEIRQLLTGGVEQSHQ